MRRKRASGDLSMKLLKMSPSGPSRVSALAVSFQFSPNLPLTKNARRPSALESISSTEFIPCSRSIGPLLSLEDSVMSAMPTQNQSLGLNSRSRR